MRGLRTCLSSHSRASGEAISVTIARQIPACKLRQAILRLLEVGDEEGFSIG
jgi:hypothetical protein